MDAGNAFLELHDSTIWMTKSHACDLVRMICESVSSLLFENKENANREVPSNLHVDIGSLVPVSKIQIHWITKIEAESIPAQRVQIRHGKKAVSVSYIVALYLFKNQNLFTIDGNLKVLEFKFSQIVKKFE